MALRYCGRFPRPGVSDLYGRGSDLYERVKDVASEARGFYNKEGLNNIDDKVFTKMMFLDGCFILEFIIMCLPMREEKYHSNMIANVKQDLFLLENQLPYIVLKKLMEDNKQHWKMMIEIFIIIWRRLHPAVKPEDKSPLHLLDMMRARFVIQRATVPGRKSQISGTDDRRSSSDERFSLNRTASDWYFYHPATMLKSMGIQFRPNKTSNLSDVKFESYRLARGVLTLPPIGIDASTRSLLLNLLAFESSCHNKLAYNRQQGVVPSYICFMDSLIDNAEDVLILRNQNVINNCLGNDQLVADLFNEIANNLVPNPHTYVEAKLGIQNHCSNKFKKWMAEGHHVHFRNPWTLLALSGSLLFIALTAAQTYLAAMELKQ
ncbi:UPF0481 protein At3g47200-like [Ziziphus jujuba]|uniref:UPF0481 protein At3g47200-like n=1 Tax=Ziziphus jujuba TaxID=326968 RepID=A0A6P4BG92_ZIZJJ|nr:UPF0481 protein At3g47200-like [Ziziphus jujuba]